MPILNYTTKIDSYKTITEIQKILSRKGVTKMIIDNDVFRNPVSLTFCIEWNNQMVAFCLPCKYERILGLMKRDTKVPRKLCTEEQSLRVSWRIIKAWIEAQMAMVDANLVTIQEVFLPYALTKDGVTLYNMLESDNKLLLINN